jgi:hypothetical protein
VASGASTPAPNRRVTEAQLNAWDVTVGCFFWGYRLQVTGPALDGWDFGKSVAHDYLTTEQLARTVDRNDLEGGTETGLPVP